MRTTRQPGPFQQSIRPSCRREALLRLILLAVSVLLSIPLSLPICASTAIDAYETPRREMVEDQLKARGIDDDQVLRAMARVARHLFVAPRLQRLAYRDFPLPIGHGQTISQPYIVAFMTEMLTLRRGQRVLEIGTGSGYQAAVLAELTDQVYTIEIIPELAESATDRLRALGYTQVRTKQGDGYHGWPEAGPFDGIVVTAAAEFIPPPLLEQLKDGGRMIIPVGSPFQVQHLMLVKKNKGALVTRRLLPVSFVPFRRSP